MNYSLDVLNLLNSFASDLLFSQKFALAFGQSVTPEAYVSALETLPTVEIRSNAELNGALGAFSAQTGKIYLSQSLIAGSPSQYQATVIEEIGHYLDYYFNGNNDSDGDEGDIFSRLVRGETIDQTTLQGLKAENDHATITLDGQVIEIEKDIISSEIPVNTYTNDSQDKANVAALTGGGYVIVWESTGQDGDLDGIFGQRFDENGAKVGSEFQVNSTIANNQRNPVVIGLNDGGYVVAWQSTGQDGDLDGIFGQKYKGNGVAVGAEFQLNTQTLDQQQFPALSPLNDGGFVAAWQTLSRDGSNFAIVAQRFDSNGTLVGPEFQVNTFTANTQTDPAIATLKNGDFVIVWESFLQDGDGFGVSARRYDSQGNVRTGEFPVNLVNTLNNQNDPAIAALEDGGYIIVWESFGTDLGVFAKRYNSNNQRVGVEFRVNTYTTNNQGDPSVTGLKDGGFLITWESTGQDGSFDGIYGQRYDSNSNAVGGEFRVNDYTTSSQSNPSVTTLVGGQRVIAWESTLQDGSGTGIYAKLFNSQNPTDLILGNNSLLENEPIGVTIGSFSTVDPDSINHSYRLVAGAGDTDNAAFEIVGNTLKNKQQFDYETKNTFSIRVQVSDNDGGSYEKQFTITVSNANEAPTVIALDHTEVEENATNGTVVGVLSTTDPDAGDTHTYTLVDDAGGRFQIVGNEIQVADGTLLDFEANTSHTVTVQTTDNGSPNLSKDETFTITVTDGNEAPTAIALNNAEVEENATNGTVVGVLSTTDPDAGDNHTYTLVDDAGGRFQIVGNEIRVANSSLLDYETNTSHTVTVRTTDNGSPSLGVASLRDDL